MKSEIAIFELAGETVTTVLKTADLVEAPNWTPDGAALVVNRNDRLYRIDLADPGFVEIDTGSARNINNDHGISPDGATLVISDSTENGRARSIRYPSAAGRPLA
jgi:Tol biopolymer transport system component